MTLVIAALHVVGFGALFDVFLRHGGGGGFTPATGLGVGLLAYSFGLRHAFDADHVAAIDNTTRALMSTYHGPIGDSSGSTKQRPVSVGFWFSLGHSTMVLVLAIALWLGVSSLTRDVTNTDSGFHLIANVFGGLISGSFLAILAALNAASLFGILRLIRTSPTGLHDDERLDSILRRRGLISRLLIRSSATLKSPMRLFPIGMLFGLGLDTATEVGLLIVAADGASRLSLEAILALPILFAAGMSLLDTADGLFMAGAYDWALTTPVRKIYYNLAVTGISAAVALAISAIELSGALVAGAHIDGGPISWLASVPLDQAGYWVVGLFAGLWIVSAAVWKLTRIEQRWSIPSRSFERSREPGGEI